MAIQYSVAVRNDKLNAIEKAGAGLAAADDTTVALRIYTGAVPANCAAANTGTLLLDINLPADWMAAASSGSKAKSGTWAGTASGGSGSTPGYFRIYNDQTTKDGTTCFIQGTCGVGSGDMAVDGTITSGQAVSVDTFQLNENNG